jgi:dihydroneopterin aldolase
MPQDRIRLHNMVFYGYHGVLAAEKEIGQRFVLDLVMYMDLREAGRKDDLKYTVNYAEVYHCVKQQVEEQRFNLLEALAEAIADQVLLCFPVQRIEVSVRKPSAPVVGIFDYVEVSIEREREA